MCSRSTHCAQQHRKSMSKWCVVVLVCTLCCVQHTASQAPISCLTQPPLPMHGQLTFRGGFTLRMKCVDDAEDVAGEAQGNPSGILYCNQNQSNRHFARGQIQLPTCSEIVRPKAVLLDVTLYYLADHPNCNQTYTAVIANRSQDVVQRFKNVITGSRSTWSWKAKANIRVPEAPTAKASCIDTKGRGLLDVFRVGIAVTYNISETIDGYTEQREEVDAIVQTARKQGKFDISITSVEAGPVTVEVGHWTSGCTEYPQHVGTILGLHRVASCRPCGPSPNTYWYIDPHNSHRCLQCPYGESTEDCPAGLGPCCKCREVKGLNPEERVEVLRNCWWRV